MSNRQVKQAVGLAFVALLLLTTVAYAFGGPPRYVGRWLAIDQVDGSSISVTMAGPPDGPFRVTWTESYFSLCGSRWGRGRGTAEVIGPNTLYLIMDFECYRNDNSAHFEDTLYYDPATNILNSLSDSSVTGLDFFFRPGSN